MVKSNVENPREIAEDIVGKTLQFIPPEVERIVNGNDPVGLKLDKLLQLFDLVNRLRAAIIAPVPTETPAFAGNKPNR